MDKKKENILDASVHVINAMIINQLKLSLIRISN